MSAAFDTIDHNILIHRLSSWFGIPDVALSWFESYLADRHFIDAAALRIWFTPRGFLYFFIFFSPRFSPKVLNRWV